PTVEVTGPHRPTAEHRRVPCRTKIESKFYPGPLWRRKSPKSDTEMTDRLAAIETTSRFRLAIAGIQTDDSQNPLEIFIAIVLNFDPSAFWSMMNRDVRAQMLPQFVL